MTNELRKIVAPTDHERNAVLVIPLQPGAELELDPGVRFVGWLESSVDRPHRVELVVESPARMEAT